MTTTWRTTRLAIAVGGALALGAGLALAGGNHAAKKPAEEPEAAQAEAGGMMDGSPPHMRGPLMLMPVMNPERGRKLFAEKGCVVCHSINGVGGEDAPPLDAENMPLPMNPFEFAARMWRGAGAMVVLQEEELGGQIELTGQELTDIIAFVHDPEEQKKFSEDDIPAEIRELMKHDD